MEFHADEFRKEREQNASRIFTLMNVDGCSREMFIQKRSFVRFPWRKNPSRFRMDVRTAPPRQQRR